MVSKNLSVCLSVTNFDINYIRTGEIEWDEIFFSSPLLNYIYGCSHVFKLEIIMSTVL